LRGAKQLALSKTYTHRREPAVGGRGSLVFSFQKGYIARSKATKQYPFSTGFGAKLITPIADDIYFIFPPLITPIFTIFKNF